MFLHRSVSTVLLLGLCIAACALLSGLSAGTPDDPPVNQCPLPCFAGTYANPIVGSSCATVTVDPEGPSTWGTAQEGCSPTCTPCKQTWLITWDCNPCGGAECDYVAQAERYDQDGEMIYPLTGSRGRTAGYGETTLETQTSCNGPDAVVGIHIGTGSQGQLVTQSMCCICID